MKPENLGESKTGTLLYHSPVNIREQPGTEHAIAETVEPGASLIVYPDQTPVAAGRYNWYWVEVPGTAKQGWMAMLGETFEGFFGIEEDEPEPEPEPEPDEDVERAKKIKEVADALRLVADRLEALIGE